MIDLHLHSTASDGSNDPAELAGIVAGAEIVALTDHDTVEGIAAFREALSGTSAFIVGAELSLATTTGSLHLLCYGTGLLGPAGTSLLGTLADDRTRRNEQLLARAAANGLDVPLEAVLAAAGATRLDEKSVGRPHVAAVLVERGYARDIPDAFDRYLAKGRPLYVPKARLRFADVIEPLAAIGVATVVAHPLSLELAPDALEDHLRTLRDLGLVGLEAHYAAYAPSTRTALAELADRLHLVATGGSDAHGRFKAGLSPLVGYGDLDVPVVSGEALIDAIARLGGHADLY
ncbi:PHP domain protein [Acidimicrobium ferrooxidans DSM 10331]|uniref:PHP domain protein n=1 Tax=Acidimicrobium ferrooxidans (strain DSM 10331 / JCM 15462 / NBRC 103882 / ICP) TaxID=525909 RepID=C7M1U8_ACIFD|nr:hypothetical protein [Acidimicrobium ferrooxidans]ACU54845.1 PHP domain protein [Acidimicrobium ferrooxidans DSM 10331]